MYSTCRRYPDRARRRPISPAGSSWRRARRGRGHAGAKAGGLPLVGTAAANGRRAPATTIGEIRGERRGADRGGGEEAGARPLLPARWPTFTSQGERPRSFARAGEGGPDAGGLVQQKEDCHRPGEKPGRGGRP